MRTLYYVNSGASWFGFYLDEGALALANDGARFNSFGAPVPEAGRASFGAVSMSGSCKVVWRTRPTIGWN